MPFPTNGQNHHNGIQNEKDIVKFLSTNPECAINKRLEEDHRSKIKTWQHEGGTQQKMDASFHLENGKKEGVSIKNHNSGGTWDWVNTTKGVPSKLKELIEDFKKTHFKTSIPKKGGIRVDLDNIFSQFLDTLTSKDIAELLNRIRRTKENTKTIIIHDRKSSRLIMIPETNMDTYCNLDNCLEFILKSTPRAKTSRQIWLKQPDGNEINTHMRIRLLLNNGITALLGNSEKNKTSVPCLKIQQDNVNEFISKCFGKIITKY